MLVKAVYLSEYTSLLLYIAQLLSTLPSFSLQSDRQLLSYLKDRLDASMEMISYQPKNLKYNAMALTSLS